MLCSDYERMHRRASEEIIPPAVLYFHEFYEPADNEDDGEWMSPTAIYESLRRIPGSGLKANWVSTFGRYLFNMPGLKRDRSQQERIYLVKRKK